MCPSFRVSIISRLLHCWMNNIILEGNRRDLNTEDLWSLDKTELSEGLDKKVEFHWSKAANKYDIGRE